jgi:hypothetical protein
VIKLLTIVLALVGLTGIVQAAFLYSLALVVALAWLIWKTYPR